MKDVLGKEVGPGDNIVYVTRRGSYMGFHKAEIISESTDKYGNTILNVSIDEDCEPRKVTKKNRILTANHFVKVD